MGIATTHVTLIFLSCFFHVTSPFYLGDYRHSKLRTFPNRNNDHLSYLGAKSRQFDVTQSRRGNEKDKGKNKAPWTGTFVNCVFKFGKGNQPEHDCKHSEDVKINWTREEDGRLMGTFSTKFHCSKRREVCGKISSPRNKVGEEKWKQVIRGKRRTVYRGNVKVVDTLGKEEEADLDEDLHEDEYDLEDLEAQSTEDEEEISDHEGLIEVIDEDKIQNKRRKAALRRAKGTVNISPTFRQEGDGEGAVDMEKEVKETEEKKDDVAEDADDEGPAEQSSDSEDEASPETSEEVTEVEKETTSETSSKDEHDDKANENDERVDEEIADGTNAPEGTVDKPESDKTDKPDSKPETSDKPPGKDENPDKSNGTTDIVTRPDSGGVTTDDPLLVPIQADIPSIVPASKLQLLIALIKDLVYDAGDYIISYFMGDLRRRLRQGRIEEKFNHKVEILAMSSNNDTEKALQIMKKKIRQQLGKPYQLEIVKLLLQLYDDWKA